METGRETSARTLAEQAARRRERILANRRRRMAVASGYTAEEVAEAARQDRVTVTRPLQASKAGSNGGQLASAESASVARDLASKRQLYLFHGAERWRLLSWEIVLVLAAALCGFGTWTQVRSPNTSLLPAVPRLSAPLVFMTLELAGFGSALMQRWLENRPWRMISECWWLLTRLRRWSVDAALFFFLYFASYMMLMTMETCLVRID
ncbi:hypothetical protein F1559_001984 [Cyanidiococcus yangmingshanensis]|uniref:Uncharacterized protein n=1 Tax=Cyanidiococcus yangmingshanensis TaxID=2690220 RepID=A0A7J7IN35_9RHOD|nr:hypothetical protein F1559_001984 [Cyanidiococcus yangmingshanensis]